VTASAESWCIAASVAQPDVKPLVPSGEGLASGDSGTHPRQRGVQDPVHEENDFGAVFARQSFDA